MLRLPHGRSRQAATEHSGERSKAGAACLCKVPGGRCHSQCGPVRGRGARSQQHASSLGRARQPRSHEVHGEHPADAAAGRRWLRQNAHREPRAHSPLHGVLGRARPRQGRAAQQSGPRHHGQDPPCCSQVEQQSPRHQVPHVQPESARGVGVPVGAVRRSHHRRSATKDRPRSTTRWPCAAHMGARRPTTWRSQTTRSQV